MLLIKEIVETEAAGDVQPVGYKQKVQRRKELKSYLDKIKEKKKKKKKKKKKDVLFTSKELAKLED